MSEQELFTQQFNQYRREDTIFVVGVIAIMMTTLIFYHYLMPFVKHSTKPIHFNLFGVSQIGFVPR